MEKDLTWTLSSGDPLYYFISQSRRILIGLINKIVQACNDNVSINPCLACGDGEMAFKLFSTVFYFTPNHLLSVFSFFGIVLMQYMIHLHFLTSCLCIKKTLSFFFDLILLAEGFMSSCWLSTQNISCEWKNSVDTPDFKVWKKKIR